LPPRRRFHSLEIEIGDRLAAQERLDFRCDLVLEASLKPPFSASSMGTVGETSNWLSAQASQPSQVKQRIVAQQISRSFLVLFNFQNLGEMGVN
jgi:hypothetical protein